VEKQSHYVCGIAGFFIQQRWSSTSVYEACGISPASHGYSPRSHAENRASTLLLAKGTRKDMPQKCKNKPTSVAEMLSFVE
jgi:hypothetical protein